MSSNHLERECSIGLSRRTGFSVPTIEQLIEVLQFQHPQDEIKPILYTLLTRLQNPQKWYSVRVNPKKSSIKFEIIKTIEKEYNTQSCGILPNILFLPVKEQFILEKYTRELTVDKFAAESMMTGANLYIPGFIKPLPKFKKGENFSIYGPNHFHVANGITQYSHKEIMEKKHGIGIKTTQSRYKIPPYRDSLYYSQGIISDHSLGPLIACNLIMEYYKKDYTIFDVCSAPGHKTCALSEIGYHKSNNQDFPNIFSIDRSNKRLDTLRHDIIRLGLENIEIIPQRIERLAVSNPELRNRADLMVLDPPCSALGTRPKLSITHTEEDYRSFFLLQRRLIKQISPFLKENGILLYTTCTLSLLENEGIVSLMKRKLGYEILDGWRLLQNINDNMAKDPIMNEFLKGISRNEEFIQSMDPGIHKEDLDRYLTLDQKDAEKLIRVDPCGEHSTGYFIAIMRRAAPHQ